MSQTIGVDIAGEQEGGFRLLLSGGIAIKSGNKRFDLALQRLGVTSFGEEFGIQCHENHVISTLQRLERTLEKFGYDVQLSSDLSQEVSNYNRENELFSDFTEKARLIRNNEFEGYPELIEDFREFQHVLRQHLVRTLYPIQLLSAFHMAFSQNSCNFAVPGAGKTSIVYGAYCFLKNLPDDHPQRVDKILVIGPISSFAPWENEFAECFGKKPNSQRLSGDDTLTRCQKEEHLYSGNPAELTLVFHGGVEGLQVPILDFLKSNRTLVVVDEAHRIKNPDGVWGRSSVEISKEARARVVLTGTPVPNGYEDLFNLFRFIYPFKHKDVLGYHYANLVDMTRNSDVNSSRVRRFTENISPYFIRIKKADLRLPPRKETLVKVKMSACQREIYDYIESEFIGLFEDNSNGTIRDVLNRARMIRLRQASTNPALLAKPLKDALANDGALGEVDPNAIFTQDVDEVIDDAEIFRKIERYYELEIPAKFAAVERLISEDIVGKSEKAIVWTIFIQNAKDFQAYLAERGITSMLLIGEVAQDVRESLISKFNDPANSEFSILIANPFAVAESISLHKGCHNAIYMERDYNCSNFLQSKDRIHRVGLQEGQVTNYYYVVCEDSIDGVIDDRLKVKIERMEAIIDHDVPLFSRVEDSDETDLIRALMIDYAQRSQ